ncbi:MAG: hypothetical protein KA968_15255, partial [Chitinophagaceae bacterium]|nr:hypothetical protein [Chitinophagaceae bacterium]
MKKMIIVLILLKMVMTLMADEIYKNEMYIGHPIEFTAECKTFLTKDISDLSQLPIIVKYTIYNNKNMYQPGDSVEVDLQMELSPEHQSYMSDVDYEVVIYVINNDLTKIYSMGPTNAVLNNKNKFYKTKYKIFFSGRIDLGSVTNCYVVYTGPIVVGPKLRNKQGVLDSYKDYR